MRFGYLHTVILGPESLYAAEASECASDQGAFWLYHDRLFESLSGRNQGGFSKDKLKGFALELELEAKLFDNCLDSGKHTSVIQSESELSSALGIRSTPSFLINGQPVVGAQPFEVFKEYIDTELKKLEP